MPIMVNQPADPRLHRLAIDLALRCRHVIQAILREEERGDCDREFYLIIRAGLEEYDNERPKV
jgi:hypothetical protein